jgi:radical SAM-linked protein
MAGEGGRPRIAPAAPLPVGIAGEREIVDLYLAERLPSAEVRSAVTRALPGGWALVDLHDVWVGGPAAPAAVVAADYRALVSGSPRRAIEGAVLALLGAATLPRERRREKRTVAYDLRPVILRLEVRAGGLDGALLAMRLRHAPDAVGRPEEVVAALGLPPAPPLPEPLTLRSVVRERVVTADEAEDPPRG